MFWLTLALAAPSLSGCVVWQSKYDALKQEYDAFKADADKRERDQQATIQKLEDALRAETARVAELEKQLIAMRSDLIALAADKTKLAASQAQLTQALKELEERKAAADKRVAEYRDLLSRFKALIDSGKLSVRIIDGQMVVELATDVLFPSASAALSPEGLNAVTEVAKILATIPGRRFQIAGHTDNIPIRTGKYPSNWYLAFDRAHSVLQAMISAGLPNTSISAASYAELRPVAGNDSDEARAKNRRIEIIVVPDLSQLPGAEELQKLDAPKG
jgi:chemotaxis protein MotB